jgi:hypothetical protein
VLQTGEKQMTVGMIRKKCHRRVLRSWLESSGGDGADGRWKVARDPKSPVLHAAHPKCWCSHHFSKEKKTKGLNFKLGVFSDTEIPITGIDLTKNGSQKSVKHSPSLQWQCHERVCSL